MYLPRHLTSRLERLASLFPAVCLVGARQVGKSTLLQHVFGQTGDFVLFDPVIDVENARADPDLFLVNHPHRPLILNEIQYAPELVAALKRCIDGNRVPGQFVLTGSQQWSVMRSVAESLAGRVVFLDLEGFSLAELAGAGLSPQKSWLECLLSDPDDFCAKGVARLELERSPHELLWRGSLPETSALPLDAIADFHNAYLRTYIDRDVRLIGDVSDWQLFGRFVRLVCALTAQEINFSQLGRELAVTPQTAKRWLDLLSATFQWFEVPPFSGNTVKRVSRRPKGYVADTGFACTAQRISTPNAIGAHPLQGALFETAVAAEVRKMCAAISPQPAMYHWRSGGGAEVDLLLERDGRYFPLEVKVTSRPSRRDTRGITALRAAYPHLSIGPGMVISPTAKMAAISEHDYALPWDCLARCVPR